ncbi:MAG: hypothetical protein ABJ388_13520 [Alphaproteobacteria bacterium]
MKTPVAKFVKPVVGSLGLIALLASFPHSVSAEGEVAYCPEQDFIDVCLKAGDSLAEINAWATKNGWEVRSFGQTLLRQSMRIESGFLRSFEIREIRFSDTVIWDCSYDFGRMMRSFRKLGCTGEFKLIDDIVPESAQKNGPHTKGLRTSFGWQYEVGRQRISVGASWSNDKYKHTHLSVTKLRVKAPD